MNSKIILAFLGGAAIGALISYKVTVSLCEQQVNEEINAFLNDWENERHGEPLSEMTDEEYEEKAKEVSRKYCPGMEANEVRKNMIYRKPDLHKVPYDAITKGSNVVQAADPRGVVELYGDDGLITSIRTPFIITIEEFTDDCVDYEKLSLYYYDEDDTLIDDRDDIIPNIYELIGDALTRFGEGSNDPDIVYVRNEAMACDYEIGRYYKRYQEEFLGLPSGEVKKRRKINEGGRISTDAETPIAFDQ